MARTETAKRQKSEKSEAQGADPFRQRDGEEPTREAKSRVHVLGPGIVCDTEPRGHATPRGRSPLEIVVDASEGFVPLWAKDTTLRWRFRERSLNTFVNPAAARREIRGLFAEALLKWGSASPVKFSEDEDLWDFELVMRSADDCEASGCVLASAFFPDAGRHQFVIYPKMFTQSRKEQVDTFIHEIGHIFGLRHFFANISETAWPSEIFGEHKKFSIMNYGSLSELTADDKNDLRRLYQLARSGALTEINGTPIRLVKPFHTLAPDPDSMVAVGQIQTVFQPQPTVAYIDGA
jgi:hypothetical protein